MKQVEERYISFLTDFGFKRIFGTAMNKDLLICFLNSLFNGIQVVKDVSYLNPEHVGDVYTDRKAIFDVYCEGENGEKFIVEMQNAYQTYFKDRSLFYSTFPIREQAPKGNDWNFKLSHVYTVALLNFNMNEDAFDKEKSKKAYRDIKNSIDTAKNQGKEEGLAEGIEIGKKEGIKEVRKEGRKEGRIEANTETAQRLLAMGLSAEQVAEATQLPLDIIEKLSRS